MPGAAVLRTTGQPISSAAAITAGSEAASRTGGVGMP